MYIDYPGFEKERLIVQNKVPQIDARLGEQICRFMQQLRQMKLEKTPGVAETLDWAMALAALHIDHLDKTIVEQTLGVVLKDWQDTRNVQTSLSELLEKIGVHSKINSL
jgi:MoxR-like ATPase